MVMLHRENKIFIIIFIIGCNNKKEYNSKEIKVVRDNCMNKSHELLGNEYWVIYNSAIDSINSWINNKIGNYAYWNSLIDYQLDSILCVNKDKNKIIMSILLPYIGEKGVQDDIKYFYGVKINNQWYFFGGATMVLPREYYQKDIHTPLSFEKLKQIATSNIYQGYLIKNTNGEWVINEQFFSTFNKDAYNYPFTTQEAWEESWLKLNRQKWEDHWKAEAKKKENQRKAEIREQYLNSLKNK